MDLHGLPDEGAQARRKSDRLIGWIHSVHPTSGFLNVRYRRGLWFENLILTPDQFTQGWELTGERVSGLKESVKNFVALGALVAVCSFVLIKTCGSSQSSTGSPSQTAGTEDQYPGSDWKYTVESADDLIKNEIISGKIKLTPHANELGFHVRKNAYGNSSVQTAPGIMEGLMVDRDMFRSPSHECPSEAVGASLPDSIILWNDDEFHVAILTYCVNSINGWIYYNNDASAEMTDITE
jgi:hypothetical protein